MTESVRKQHPEWFSADPRYDAVSSKEDLERGTQREIAAAKAKWISQHGITSWEELPATKEEAARRNAVPDSNMNRAQWLAMPFRDRVKLSGILGADAVARIMARSK